VITAAVLFGMAALGGLTMATLRLRGRAIPPTWLAIVHGLFAVAGLVTLITAVTGADTPQWARYALIGFIGAALGGATLFLGFHLRGRALPIPIVFVHGSVALISFVLLVVAIMGV
jgi:hypothetical protein